MTLPFQVALTVAPLACYFYVVGVWQSGNRSRVVSGLTDYALLAFGVCGLLTVGPVGQVLLDLIFGDVTPFAWGLWIVFLVLWGWVFSGPARRRLIVYNIDPTTMREAVAAAIREMGDASLTPTLKGFESSLAHLSLTVEGSKSFRVGTVEAQGNDAEEFIQRLKAPLRTEVRRNPVGPSRVTWLMFILSWMTLIVPSVVFLMTEPNARAALRAFLQRVRG